MSIIAKTAVAGQKNLPLKTATVTITVGQTSGTVTINDSQIVILAITPVSGGKAIAGFSLVKTTGVLTLTLDSAAASVDGVFQVLYI